MQSEEDADPSALAKLRALRSRVFEEAFGFELLQDDTGKFWAPPEGFPEHRFDEVGQISLAIGYPTGSRGSNSARLLVLSALRRAKIAPLVQAIESVAGDDMEFVHVGRSRVHAGWHTTSVRPVRIGSSVGHYKGQTGSITFFASTAEDDRRVLVSCSHVLACLAGHALGDALIQPGRADRGVDARDRIATLERVSPIRHGARQRNLVDAAYGSLLPGNGAHTNELFSDQDAVLGRLASPERAFIGDRVMKIGRSGLTHGVVRAEIDNLVLWLDRKGGIRARFDEQLVIEGVGEGSFSSSGDSGAVVFNEKFAPVAQIVGGSDAGASNGRALTYASHIGNVLNELAISI